MLLELKTIAFNHDPLSAATSAMNIRRNKDFEVQVPEYDAAIPRTPAESCAAYARDQTKGQNVIVRVSFQISAPANVSYEVRALGGGVLGALESQPVTFGGGTTAQTLDFPLTHRNFSQIQRQDVTWQWQFRPTANAPWQNMVSTTHRIYVVLKVPPSPWTQTYADKRNPWTDLLDTCCAAAAGSQAEETAAERIAKSVYLSYSLRYDIVSGAPRYGFWTSGSSFDLTNWIEYVLRGNAPATPKFCPGTAEEYKNFLIVNCYDCAASAALMAKVVGAESDYYFHGPFGYLNYVEPIGRGKCNNPFYGCMGNNPEVGPDAPRTGFGNHAYQKLAGTRNFDACMREWLPAWLRFLLWLLWLLVWLITLGTVDLKALRLRAGGWLIDLLQATYNQRTIDVSAPFESAAAGGAPTLQTLQFKIV